MMFLSIIIPVYNAEKYLAECLESCLAQDIPSSEYEIICVNDGSKDNSAVILQGYAERYDNIVVISQENAGVSAARNAGIDIAQGDYIWFVDADDFIRENILGKLCTIVSESNIDKLSFGHYQFEETLRPTELDHVLLLNAMPTGSCVCESLYSRLILKDKRIRFYEDISYGEDALFWYEFESLKLNSYVLNEIVYFYRKNSTSAMQTWTDEAKKKRRESEYKRAQLLTKYALKNKQELFERRASENEVTGILMPEVRTITILTAKLPDAMRKDILNTLSANDLFPLFLYRKPRDWFPKKIHMNHAYKGIKGKVLDILNFYSTTRIGFVLLLFVNKLFDKRNHE